MRLDVEGPRDSEPQRVVSDCRVDPAKMPLNVPNDFPPVRQETDMPGPLQQLQPGPGNGLSQQLLAGSRNDGILRPGEHQCGSVDLPEPFGDIETLELGQTLSHHTLVGLPDSARQRSLPAVPAPAWPRAAG